MTPIQDPTGKRGHDVRSFCGVPSYPQKGAGYVLACFATRNGFGHPAGKIAVAQLIQVFCYESCGMQSLFGTNQQTSAFKRLKATGAWNILLPKSAQSQALQTVG